MKETLIKLQERLIDSYGYDKPIFTKEIMLVWAEFSPVRVAQLIKEMTEKGLLTKYIKGVYYISTITALGRPSYLGFRQVVEKKYIENGDDVYGYYGGLSLLNSMGLTTQVPSVLEIVTAKESTRVRQVRIRNSKVILRKARTVINKENVYALAFLEALNEKREGFNKEEIESLKRFVKYRAVNQKDVFDNAKFFPGKTVKRLIDIGVDYVFAQ